MKPVELKNILIKAWVENGVIRCCSQMCTDDCPRFTSCEDVNVDIFPRKKKIPTERGN